MLSFTSGEAAATVQWRRVGTVAGTLTNGQLCYTNGTDIVCDTNAPTLSGTNLGIGTTTPLALSHVNGTLTNPAAGPIGYFNPAGWGEFYAYPGAFSQITAAPTSDTDANTFLTGMTGWIDQPATNTNSVVNSYGVQGIVTNESTTANNASNWSTSGVDGEVYNTGNIGWISGVNGDAESDSGTVAYGLAGGVFATNVKGGTVSSAGVYGVTGAAYIHGGTVDSVNGVSAVSYIDSGSVTGSFVGVYVAPAIVGGTVANRYGIYIDDGGGAATTDDYGLYQVAAYQKNYFAGAVGIGSSIPKVALDLSLETDAVSLPSGTTGTRPTGVNGMIRYNSTTPALEAYVNGAWSALITGSGGLGSGVTLGTSTAATNPSRVSEVNTGFFSPASGAVGVSSLGTEMMRVNATGVGIGTTTPAFPMDVRATTVGSSGAVTIGSSSGSDFGEPASPTILANVSVVPASDQYGIDAPGVAGLVDVPASNTQSISDTMGVIGVVTNESTAANNGTDYSSIYGVGGFAQNSGTLYNLAAFSGEAENDSGNLTGGLSGISTGGYTAAGNVSQVVGANLGAAAYGGTVGNMYGVDTAVYADGGTVTGALYGVYVYPSIGGGTVANRYGIYIDDGGGAATTDDYGLYQVAAYQKNYFAGAVGIGSSKPKVALDLSLETDAVALPVGTTGTRPSTAANGMMRYNSTNGKFEAYQANSWQDILTSAVGNGLTLGTSALVTNPSRASEVSTGLFSPASGAVGVSSLGTEIMRVNATGVGIGTTTPGLPLQVSTTTIGSSGAVAYDVGGLYLGTSYNTGGTLSQITAVPAADIYYPTHVNGMAGVVDVPAGNANTVAVSVGGVGIVTNESTAANNLTASPAFSAGLFGHAYNSGNINTIYGVTAFAYSPTGTANQIIGGDFENQIDAGTSNYVAGIDSFPYMTGGTVSGNVLGIDNEPYVIGGTVTGGLYGEYISVVISGGTVANRYGIYIADGGGAATGDDYGLYQVAAYQKNYFAGSVGIGTSVPASDVKADIAGVVKVAGTGSEPCTAAQAGSMRYNPTGKYMEICTYP